MDGFSCCHILVRNWVRMLCLQPRVRKKRFGNRVRGMSQPAQPVTRPGGDEIGL